MNISLLGNIGIDGLRNHIDVLESELFNARAFVQQLEIIQGVEPPDGAARAAPSGGGIGDVLMKLDDQVYGGHTGWSDANPNDITDAPADGNIYGRGNGSWVSVLPLTGGTLVGPLTINAGLAVTGNVECNGDTIMRGNVQVEKALTLTGIPLYSTGLPPGGIWKDSTGLLHIIL